MENVSTTSAEAAFERKKGPGAQVQALLHRFPTLSPTFVLALAVVFFTAFGHGRFLRPATIGIIFQQTAVLAALAVGQTLIILTAGVDLAVGTGMILCHLVVAKLAADHGVPSILALLSGALAGAALGAFHGFWITKIELPPFIITLATMFIFQSSGLLYSQARTVDSKQMGGDNSLLLFAGRHVSIGAFRITFGVLMVIGLYVVFTHILTKTTWGSHVYATGGDKEAARLAGINVNRVLFSVYVVAGLLYAFGGWIQLGRSMSASTNAAVAINLETVTAVVIGGTSLFGGRGRLSGTLVGALVVAVMRIGLPLANVNAYWQEAAIGSLILVATTLDQWIRKAAK